MKAVSIIGGTLWGNRGAAAMLETTIGEIRAQFPETRFHVYSYYSKADRRLLNDPAGTIAIHDARPITLALVHFPLAVIAWFFSLLGIKFPLPKGLAALRDSDVLLDIGGITFADGRTVFLLFNVLTIWPAMLLKTPVVKLAQAVGPFKTPINRLISRAFLPRCAYLFARGSQTVEHLKTISFPMARCQQANDIAFLYQPTFTLSEENEVRVDALIAQMAVKKSAGQRVIAISPSALVMEKSEKSGIDYHEVLLSLMRSSEDRNTFFVIFPNACRASQTKSRNNDIVTINAMKARWDTAAQNAVFVDYDINTRAIRRITAAADCLITSRFHAMISGLATLTPTFVVGWGHKYAETLAQFDLAGFTIDYTDTALLEGRFAEFMRQQEMIYQKLADRLPGVTADSKKQFITLREFLEN